MGVAELLRRGMEMRIMLAAREVMEDDLELLQLHWSVLRLSGSSSNLKTGFCSNRTPERLHEQHAAARRLRHNITNVDAWGE